MYALFRLGTVDPCPRVICAFVAWICSDLKNTSNFQCLEFLIILDSQCYVSTYSGITVYISGHATVLIMLLCDTVCVYSSLRV